MKINFLGHWIDLDEIYAITKIRKPNRHRFNDSEGSDDDEVDWDYSFCILFMNRKSMRIHNHGDYKGQDLTRVREELFKLWAPLQNDVPVIKPGIRKDHKGQEIDKALGMSYEDHNNIEYYID